MFGELPVYVESESMRKLKSPRATDISKSFYCVINFVVAA